MVTINRPGDVVGGPAGGWEFKHSARNFYWFSKPYNLSEVYHPDGRLKQIYIHIASPARACGQTLIYTDYELDVVKRPGQELLVRDEDEFAHACQAYGYTPEFQCSCREAVSEALQVADCWRVTGAPRARRRRPRRVRSRGSARIVPRDELPGREETGPYRGASAADSAGTRTVTPAMDSSTRNTDV